MIQGQEIQQQMDGFTGGLGLTYIALLICVIGVGYLVYCQSNIDVNFFEQLKASNEIQSLHTKTLIDSSTENNKVIFEILGNVSNNLEQLKSQLSQQSVEKTFDNIEAISTIVNPAVKNAAMSGLEMFSQAVL